MQNEIDRQIQDAVNVLAAQGSRLDNLRFDESQDIDKAIGEADEFLALRGIAVDDAFDDSDDKTVEQELICVPSWNDLVEESENLIGGNADLEKLLSKDKLEGCNETIREFNEAYKCIHRLDKTDIAIAAIAAIVSAAIDILAVGVPKKTKDGLKEAPLGNFIRDNFERAFPADEMRKLESTPMAKVPYDVINRNELDVVVEGLSAYYHRLLSLGHDPLLGLFVGVHDIVKGKMTTIDKAGKVVTQVVEVDTERTAKDIYTAVCKQVTHFMTDVNTSMGLPAPLMGVFNLFQFGTIGEDEQTIAEIVQSMYSEGYDFIHFASQSIPVMVAEAIVRLGWAAKRISERRSIEESIPFSTKHTKHPKLGTMLFIAHTGAAAINAGNVYFTKNPMAINYPQWISFAIYSFKQARWAFLDKPDQQNQYVMDRLAIETAELMKRAEVRLDSLEQGITVVFD